MTFKKQTLPSIAARLNRCASEEPDRVGHLLRELAPHVCRQLQADGSCHGLLALWGTSSNFEGEEKRPIVHETVLKAIGEVAGVGLDGVHPHAGLLHTYGYLFSTVRTPFGFKRARWVRPAIARGTGLAGQVISPDPKQGTLLANVTGLAGRLAFDSDSWIHPVRETVAPPVCNLDPTKFRRVRVIETVEQVDGHEISAPLELRSDLVWFLPGQVSGKEQALLVYSTRDDQGHRLITAFPVGGWVEKKLRKQVDKQQAIKTRYNAWLPGVSGHDLSGHSTIEEL